MRMIATRDIEELRICAHDLITWDNKPGQHPFLLARRTRYDYGSLLVALNTGALEPLVVTRASSPEAAASVDRALAEELRPRLRLLRRMG